MKKLIALLAVLAICFSITACSYSNETRSTESNSSQSTRPVTGKKSVAKTLLRNAIVAAKAIQTGLGALDFSDITIDNLNSTEPDIDFAEGVLPETSSSDQVGVIALTDSQIVFQTRDSKGCYYVELNSQEVTRYATSKTCETPTTSGEILGQWSDQQSVGWPLI